MYSEATKSQQTRECLEAHVNALVASTGPDGVFNGNE
jgi:hypothetical protein